MKKRSKYRPRAVLSDPMNYVLSGMRAVRDLPGVYLNVQLKNRAALEQIRLGTATRADVDMLIGAFNITEALAMNGTGGDWMQEIKQGQDALLALSRRGVARGMQFIMKAQEWEALKVVMDLHEEQLAHCTVMDIERAHDAVQKVVAQGRARAVVQTRKEEA